MKKILFLLLISIKVFAQTGIGTTTPNASAKLEVASIDKGFLPPRVALTATNATSPVTLPATGLMVYNITSNASVIPGYYFWNGSLWMRLIVPTDNAANVTGTVAVANGGTGTTTGSITGSGALTFTAGGSNQSVTLTPSGTGDVIASSDVGIGTTNVTDRLIIGSAVAVHDGGNKVIGFGWSPGSSNSIVAGYPAEIRLDQGNGRLSFGTDPSLRSIGSAAGVQRRMTITSAGSVGIGTETPSATLEIGSSNGSVAGNLILNPTTTGTGVEGGEINFRPAPVTTSPVAQTWAIDQVSNDNNPRLRIFPTVNGEVRGFSIKDNGNFGIGTASPRAKLHVQSADQNSVYIESTTSDNNGMLILNANTGSNWDRDWHEFMIFQKQGTTMGFIGAVANSNSINYSSTSDYRLKTDLRDYKGLELVNKIKTYDYAWKSNNYRMYGVMAHELQDIIPYAVSGTKDAVDKEGKITPQAVDYSKLTPILVKAIQEQDAQIQTLEQRIIQLEKLIQNKR